MSDLSSWVLAAMTTLQPPSTTTPRIAASYAETAEAVAQAAEEAPLFDGPNGTRETAALLLGIALHESNFRPWIKGDHDRSHGLFQVQPPTIRGLGGDGDDLLSPKPAARAAVIVARASMRSCRSRPLEERLSWFAGGGPECPNNQEALGDSRAMFAIARRVLRESRVQSPEPHREKIATFKPIVVAVHREKPALFATYSSSEKDGKKRAR